MKILEIYKQKLRYKNYSQRTIDTYVCYLEKFLRDGKIADPYQVSLSQIKNYLENKKYSSISQQNQIIGSLKLFAKYILGKTNLHLSKIERPKKKKKLPRVIDVEILKLKIDNIRNLKHKAALSLGLSCALRVSEVRNLKMSDIDRHRKIIHIRNSKGQKDRIVPLSDKLLTILENYYRAYRPQLYLFNGQKSLQYATASLEKIIKKYVDPNAGFHMLRHSSATAIHENGTDIATLAKMMGHNSVKTTMIYTHISNNALQKIKTPI